MLGDILIALTPWVLGLWFLSWLLGLHQRGKMTSEDHRAEGEKLLLMASRASAPRHANKFYQQAQAHFEIADRMDEYR